VEEDEEATGAGHTDEDRAATPRVGRWVWDQAGGEDRVREPAAKGSYGRASAMKTRRPASRAAGGATASSIFRRHVQGDDRAVAGPDRCAAAAARARFAAADIEDNAAAP